MPGLRGLWLAAGALVALAATAPAAGPVLGVWYRGTPAGVPVQDELALIRAFGFSAIVWPWSDPAHVPELARLADLVGLEVVTLDEAARGDRRWYDRKIREGASPLTAADIWTAVSDGARLVTVDAGAPVGAGLRAASGAPAPWVAVAQGAARQFQSNAGVLGQLQPGPAIEIVAGTESSCRLTLFEAGRAWVIIAANSAPTAASMLARLPRSIPYGPWIDLLDGSDMAMVSLPSHHEYRAMLPPGAARVYVIDKVR